MAGGGPRGRNATLFAAVGLLCLSILSALAETFVDSFGQEVDRRLDDLVSEARELRMNGSQGDIERSIEILNSVVDENENYYRAWYNLGLSHFARDASDIDALTPPFNRAIEIQEGDMNINDPSIYNTVGYIYLTPGMYAEAEEFLQKANSFSGQYFTDWTASALYYNLGRLHFELLDYDESKFYLNKAVESGGNPKAIDLLEIIDLISEKGEQ